MKLDAIGGRFFWPTGPGSYTEDDYWCEPELGLAVVAGGHGAIGGQAKPAGKLAVWSIAGEVRAWRDRAPAEERLALGLRRARAAVARLTASWPPGLVFPSASVAAVLLEGETAVVAHIGDCRVSRLGARGLSAVTRDHTIRAEWPAERVIPKIAGVRTRALGGEGEPELQRIIVAPGDVLLLATGDVHEALSDGQIADSLALAAAGAEGGGAAAIESIRALLRTQLEYGSPTLVVARVTHGPVGERTSASREAPPLRWLYAPGEALAEPPAEWAAPPAGSWPWERWVSEVFRVVMGADE